MVTVTTSLEGTLVVLVTTAVALALDLVRAEREDSPALLPMATRNGTEL